jgi:hypothetical protein
LNLKQVVGAESTPCDDDAQQGNYVARHILALKRQTAFRRSRFKVIVEINYGGPIWATNIAAAIATHNLVGVDIVRRNKRGIPDVRPGVYTTKENKFDMMERLKRALEYRAVYFSDKFVSICVPTKSAQETVEEILFQLLGYRDSYKKDPSNPLKPIERKLDGKEGPAGADDMVDVLGMNLYWNKLV